MTMKLVKPETLSPEMQALTPLQRAFVEAKVFDGLDNTRAYRKAGYAISQFDAQAAYHVAHHPGVQAAIKAETLRLTLAEGPKSIAVLTAIRDNVQAKDSDRIKAGLALLDRGGYSIIQQHQHVHVHKTFADQEAEFLDLAKQLGWSDELIQTRLAAVRKTINLEKTPTGEYVAEPMAEDDDEF